MDNTLGPKLANIEIGTEVVSHSRAGTTIRTITRLTDTSAWTGYGRYRRSDGVAHGKDNYSSIRLPEPGEVATIRAQAALTSETEKQRIDLQRNVRTLSDWRALRKPYSGCEPATQAELDALTQANALLSQAIKILAATH
jgi:hypothetical protein